MNGSHETTSDIPEEIGIIDEIFSILSGSHNLGIDRHERLIGLIGLKSTLSHAEFSREYLRRIHISKQTDRATLMRWILGIKQRKEFHEYRMNPYFYTGETSSLKDSSLEDLQGLLRKIALFMFLKGLKKDLGSKGIEFTTKLRVSGIVENMLYLL